MTAVIFPPLDGRARPLVLVDISPDGSATLHACGKLPAGYLEGSWASEVTMHTPDAEATGAALDDLLDQGFVRSAALLGVVHRALPAIPRAAGRVHLWLGGGPDDLPA